MAWLPSSAETVRTLEFDYLALTVLSMFFLLFLFLLLEQWIYLSCLERWIFIHSFIPAISIAPLQVLYYSEGLPTTARILYRSFTPKRTGMQLQVKDLPNFLTWRLERESNPRPSG